MKDMSLEQQINDTTEKHIQISDKPVAWMSPKGFVYEYHQTRPIDADIPLYTAPRELSDAEILELWAKKNKLNGAQDIVDFAKQLLKKASEK
jgi:hypothetical protein